VSFWTIGQTDVSIFQNGGRRHLGFLVGATDTTDTLLKLTQQMCVNMTVQ